MCYTCKECGNIAGCKLGPNYSCTNCKSVLCSLECEHKHICIVIIKENLKKEIKSKLDEWIDKNTFYDDTKEVKFLQIISNLLDF